MLTTTLHKTREVLSATEGGAYGFGPLWARVLAWVDCYRGAEFIVYGARIRIGPRLRCQGTTTAVNFSGMD